MKILNFRGERGRGPPFVKFFNFVLIFKQNSDKDVLTKFHRNRFINEDYKNCGGVGKLILICNLLLHFF